MNSIIQISEMSEFKCPIQSCGRILESAYVLKQHIRRRHPSANLQTMARNEQDRVMQEEINKLPKIRTLKLQSGEHRLPDIHRRSSSKGKVETSSNNTLNSSKITSVISESRSIVESTENSTKQTKRPSLNKRPSNTIMIEKHQKLPELKPMQRPKKLEILNEQIKLKKSGSQQIEQNIMYSTAPNFKKLEKKDSKIRQRSGSKERINSSNTINDGQRNNSSNNELLLIKTQQGFHEKQARMHKVLKRQSEKVPDRAADTQSVLVQSTKEKIITKETSKVQSRQEKGKQTERRSIQVRHDLKHKNRRQASLRRGQNKQETSNTYNFDERIIVFDESIGPKLAIPPLAKIQFLYANNCKLSYISLGGVQFLREISLQHNNLKQLSFLNYASNGNIEKLFVDHNQLSSIDYLPPSLKVLSATFNNIAGLDICSKQLSNSSLNEVDFTFNPIRKESNYKLHLLSCCQQLKKIDGIKITKFDLQLAAEYCRMLDEQLGLIPSSKTKNLIISRCSQSPSTVISSGEEPEVDDVSQQDLLKDIGKLQKVIKSTKEHLNIIRKENEIIQGEIAELNIKQEDDEGDFTTLYNKLRTECAALELLNFLQWADEEELLELIEKKKKQIACE